jgi:FkbM family methyltransferase
MSPEPTRDFAEVAPDPVPEWKLRLVNRLMKVPPLSSPRVRARIVRSWRARRRAKREKLAAAGDVAVLRPALYGMADALDRYLDRDGGYFVEAGANDGYEQSNTFHLERQRGWRGLLVEPVPSLYREVLVERPRATVRNCALVPFDHPEDEVELRYGGLMTVVSGTHGSADADSAFVRPAFALGLEDEYTFRVPARPLSDVLDEVGAPEIDFMSLDVEGYEPQVLRGLDLDRHAPRFLLVEMHDIDEGRREIEAVLGERYVPVEQLSPLDVLYARADQPAAQAASTRS